MKSKRDSRKLETSPIERLKNPKGNPTKVGTKSKVANLFAGKSVKILSCP